METKAAEGEIIAFIRGCFKSAGRRTAIVGLSGGLDSAVALSLCVKALGKSRAIAVLLPSSSTPGKDMRDAQGLARSLGVKTVKFAIEPALDSFGNLSKGRLNSANLSARIRMAALYSIAAKQNGLVVGTGDKSEFLLGYFTKYGDGAADFFPIGGLYKTEVRELGKHLGLPEAILRKPPSPALWKGQTAEGELGFSYEEADEILRAIERRASRKIIEEKFGKKLVASIIERMEKNFHKRIPAPVCRI
ncbi:putative NH(3)-dependent NAD(+) synthetase [uncultured archaeon]|nr:putative NH(3)-dependent NAD(+) synthetase [uncultured archaeon]